MNPPKLSRTALWSAVILITIGFFGLAESSQAASVFYSVGQDNTTNLMTGTPNISISSSAGTFMAAQTGNIGVGDDLAV